MAAGEAETRTNYRCRHLHCSASRTNENEGNSKGMKNSAKKVVCPAGKRKHANKTVLPQELSIKYLIIRYNEAAISLADEDMGNLHS